MKDILMAESIGSLYSEKKDGNVDTRFSSQQEVEGNLLAICRARNLDPQALVQAQQIHATSVKKVGAADREKTISGADSLITDDPGVCLMLRVADCIQIYLFDPLNRAIGIAHSGWRGSIGKIILVTIMNMNEQFGSNPNDLIIALGPSLLDCCHIMREEPLQAKLPEWGQFIRKQDNGYCVDVPGFVKKTAAQAGVKEENVFLSTVCTAMQDSLFSHARSTETGEPSGRFAALIYFKH